MKIGLFFGSFNPVHIGHMIIAQYMLEFAGMDQIWLVVSPQNPFKKKENLLNEYERLNLVNLAIGDHLKISSSNIEFYLPRPSYTIDTLVYLKEKYPAEEFSLIMGSDNLNSITKWKNSEILLRDYSFLIYKRPGYHEEENQIEGDIRFFDVPLLDISSTYIRENIRLGKDLRYFMPDPVYQYIKEYNLYKK